MKKSDLLTASIPRLALLAIAGLLLAGCSSYYGTRDDGVYYQTPSYRASAVRVDPTLYPFWSLDYFYYSHYYHPYSVVVHRYDPWYYPYPGWYYGYRPGPRHIGHHGHFRYPWYRLGDRYGGGYRSWPYAGYWGFDPYSRERFTSGDRVRQIDARLRELETRRSVAIRDQRPDRRLTPRSSPMLPATRRGAAIRRDELRRPAPVHPGTRAAEGSETSSRQALIERLRAAPRRSDLPDRNERSRERRPTAPPAGRDLRSRERSAEPTAPARQRPVETAPPRSSPPRGRERSPRRSPTRTNPPKNRSRSDQRQRD